MQIKKCLSGVLAAALVFNTGLPYMSVSAAEPGQTAATQIASQPEVVYVNSYDASQRSVSFNDHWRFYLGDANGAEAVAYNDASWNNVTLPHDYSIDQGFTTAAPAEQESGYVLGGTGWYRKAFTLSSDMENKVISVDFDGVYMNATVYINGVKLGTHPYGYTSFSFELPNDLLKFGGEENVIVVKVEHQQPSSRWYSGSGIYRDVNLTVTEPVHIARYGTQVTTPDIADGSGKVVTVTTVENNTEELASISVRQIVYEKGGTETIATGTMTEVKTIAAGESAEITSDVTVAEPKLWDTTNPNLYTVRTEIYENDILVDSYDSDFGFRWVSFTKDNGFFLNGENIKLQGVCMHHDQGALGSEAWYSAIERQVDTLIDMGVNAIRVTHNPASQALIDICNEKGIMLIEEAFDTWIRNKNGNSNDYAKWFAEALEEDNQIVGGEDCQQWAEFDIKEMVKRGRNNPSIIMWSLGNEVFEGISGDTSTYPEIAVDLMEWIAEEDTSHYVTFGDNRVKSGNTNAINTAAAIAAADQLGLPGGIVGYNYGGSSQISAGYSDYGWMVYGSETASSVNSRGIYDRKVSNGDGGVGDKRLTSYDKSCVGWGHLASQGMWITMQQDFNAGEFIWTGFDYLGEPTPWNNTGTGANGTSKNSYFGIIDTAGIPKDSFYLYQSQWKEEATTLHVLPVWDEEEIVLDSEGKAEVVVYSDAPVIKLYLNGEEVGSAVARTTSTPTGGYQNYTTGIGTFDTSKASGHTSLYATFNVPYEAGTLEAKAFETDGTTPITDTEGRSVVETTASPSRLQAEADRTEMAADGKELCYVTIDVTDTDGKLVNAAEPEITVSVEGDGKLMALDNGVQSDMTSYTDSTRSAGKGKLVAIVQSTEDAGSFTVTATANGYASASVEVTTTAAEEETDRVVTGYKLSKNYYVKSGESLVLPTEVEVIYSDDTSETKAVTWGDVPEGENNFTVSGVIEDFNLQVSVNVTVIDTVAAILNYSAAIGKDAALSLPSTRPAVTADGSILSAEFPVTWDISEDVTAALGTKVIQGSAEVFGETLPVTASIRVTSGEYRDGSNAMQQVPEMYIGGVSSKADSSVAAVMNKLKDGNQSKADAAWTGRDTLDFRLDTAVVLKDFTLHIKDTAPTSDTIKIYASGNNGESWTEAECKVTNRREDGVTVRTYTPVNTISETWYRVECTKTTTLTEVEMNTSIPTFNVGNEAALTALNVGGRIADTDALERGYMGVYDTDLTAADIIAEGKDNASITILEKDQDNVIRVLIESEDHENRSIFAVMLGAGNVVTGVAADDSRDYPTADITGYAPSYASNDGIKNALDGNLSTIWHTSWGNGVGETDLSNKPELRYYQMELKEVTRIDAVRYYPRISDGTNGIVVDYRIEVSLDGENWTVAGEGTGWSSASEWKIAAFAAVEAKYVRLYGVNTLSDGGGNVYMSAAEIRVRVAGEELYSGNTTVTLAEADQEVLCTGSEITPKPLVVYRGYGIEPIILVETVDYTLSYENNVEPGTAEITINGAGNYVGILKTNFTIKEVEMDVIGYEPVSVTTGKGEDPMLPGTVIAHTNVGDQIMEVRWDKISAAALNSYSTIQVYGTVAATSERVAAAVTISDVIGIRQVTAVTVVGSTPVLPSQVPVYYSNGQEELKDVTWAADEADFSQAGIVEVAGTVGKHSTQAQVRVSDVAEDRNNTPIGQNLSLNENGISNTTSWPRTFSYVAGTDYAQYTTDGEIVFDGSSSKKIWSDWENGQYHTNKEAAVGARDHVPFVVTAFGEKGTTDDNKQKKYTVNKISVGFLEEDGESISKVRLPEDYKIEYYSENEGVIDASRINNSALSECSNVRGWREDNPVKAHEGWTEVTYVGRKPAIPKLEDSKRMIDIPIERVETTAIRITVTPQENNWAGIEEIETYYVPITANEDYEVTAIQLNGEDILGQFDQDTKTLEVAAEGGEITAAATNNASITILETVNGTAKVIFLPENADENKIQEYTVIFTQTETKESYLVAASDENVELLTGKAQEGTVVTFTVKEGYEFTSAPAILKSEDNSETGIAITEEAGVYSFTMPAYAVTVSGATKATVYKISYILGGGSVTGNPGSYTIESKRFTLKNPTREGYTFIGWINDDIHDPAAQITVAKGSTGDLVFVANWRRGTTYTVSFDVKGGSEVEAQEVDIHSGMLTEPAAPVRKGYTFAGWFMDEALTQQWNFAEDVVSYDLTLFAKWTESPVTVNTELPVHYLNQPFNLPGNISITVNDETFNSNVTWNQEDLATVKNAKDVAAYTVRGTLAALENRSITVEVLAAPADIVYFVDSGAEGFTTKGQLLAAASKETMKNETADQAYTEESGWGYINAPEELAVYGRGDAYETIRCFEKKVNQKTMSYRFALEAGTYQVGVGFFDPWAHVIGDIRYVKVQITDQAADEIAISEEHHIDGTKAMVSLEQITVEEDGTIDVNLIPQRSIMVNNKLDDCDVLVSFIVITKVEDAKETVTVTFDTKGGSEVSEMTVLANSKLLIPQEPSREGYEFQGWYRDEACTQVWDFQTDTVSDNTTLYARWSKNDIAGADEKARLKAAIDIARGLKASDYSADSFAVLSAAITAAEAVYEAEEADKAAIDAQITALTKAVSELESSYKAENGTLNTQITSLKAELESIRKDLNAKEEELQTEKANAAVLAKELETAQTNITTLTEQLQEANSEKAALERQLEQLQGSVGEQTAEINRLNEQITALNTSIGTLETELSTAQQNAANLQSDLGAANGRIAVLEAERVNLTTTVSGLEAQLAQVQADKETAEAEAEKAKTDLDKLVSDAKLKTGDTVVENGVKYRVTDAEKKLAEVYGVTNKKAVYVRVETAVTVKGERCKVTTIAKKSFAGMKKLKRVIIGSNITKIGARAFYGDKQLKRVIVNGKKLKTIGKAAFKGIASNAVIKVPKLKRTDYKKLFKGKGQKATVKIK